MALDALKKTGPGSIPKPPSFLKTKRAREAWRYMIRALDSARLDYRPALMQLALLAEKIEVWREHADAIERQGCRYDEDSNGGSLETDESRAERRARGEVIKDLDESGLTVLSAAKVRAIDRLSEGDLFDNPFDALPQMGGPSQLTPDKPPWAMGKDERRLWRDLVPLLEGSGFDFSTSGVAVGLICASVADWLACKHWIEDNKGLTFAVARDTGRTYEVSASYNRVRIAKQIRDLLRKNGMTVASCAKNKALSRGRLVSEELVELLGFISERPD